MTMKKRMMMMMRAKRKGWSVRPKRRRRVTLLSSYSMLLNPLRPTQKKKKKKGTGTSTPAVATLPPAPAPVPASPPQKSPITEAGASQGISKKERKALKKQKAKAAKGDDVGKSESDLAPNGQPTNKALPAKIEFPPRSEGNIRIAAWNICGLAASSKKVCAILCVLSLPLMLVCARGSKIM